MSLSSSSETLTSGHSSKDNHFRKGEPFLGNPYAAPRAVRNGAAIIIGTATVAPPPPPSTSQTFMKSTLVNHIDEKASLTLSESLSEIIENDLSAESEMALYEKSVQMPSVSDSVEATPDTEPSAFLRHGDVGIGVPFGAPKVVRVLAEEESKQREQRRLELDLEEQLELRANVLSAALPGSFGIPAVVRRMLMGTLLLGVCLIGLYVIGQGLQIFSELEHSSTLVKWSVGTLAILLAGIATGYCVWMLRSWLGLSRFKQVNLRAIKVLEERRKLQALVNRDIETARVQLVDYLKSYPLDHRHAVRLKSLGLSDETFKELTTARDQLLDRSSPMSNREWIDSYRISFQSVLDKAAMERVNIYSKRSGWATAAAPRAILDQLIVFYACTAMMTELMLIYNLRPGFGQTSVLLAQAVIQSFLSGTIGKTTESAMDSVMDSLQNSLFNSKIAKMIGSKVSEGVVNGLLIYRLGRQAVKTLQPVRE